MTLSQVLTTRGILLDKLDHDTLSEMFKNAPERFEEVTKGMIEDFIKNAPQERQQRLRAIQWNLDNRLKLCKDPTQRFNLMVELFFSQFAKFKNALDEFK